MSSRRLRVLCVDDDPTARVLMRAALKSAGHEVVLAGGGAQALREFRAGDFDLVMLDVDMPDLDGYEVCATMRQEGGEFLPIMMVTGMDDVDSVEKAYDSGATDFVQKPLNLALIGHRVRYLMRSSAALRDLRDAKERDAAVLAAIPDLLFEIGLDGRYLDCHTPRSDLLYLPPERLIGRAVDEVLPADAAEICLRALQIANIHGVSTGHQYELELPTGRAWFELSIARKGDPAVTNPTFIVVARNITERKEAEQRIMRLAFYDSLTGLPNRQSFLERVDREIRHAEHTKTRLGVLFLDFDGFKTINDTMGHSVGDQLLRQAAVRLQDGVRQSDVISRLESTPADVELARLGGDEFTALILDINGPMDAMTVARRAIEIMHAPFFLEGREVVLSTSVGIALYPDDGADAATLLRNADTAMYHAKESGRGNFQFYSAELTEVAIRRLDLERSLRVALETGQFDLAYQPQYDLEHEAVRSVEALLRWTHPERGEISPLDFIPYAEESGLILPIGHWVIQRACEDAARWCREGMPLRVAVNLSPLQLKERKLVEQVGEVLKRTGLDPALLQFEITEGAMLEDSEAMLSTLAALRALGVSISLDDFGTGYSSLSYLKRMSLANLKIDRSFISGLPDDEENRVIVRAILSMASSLGVSVTAEGVETVEQALALRDMACDTLQGFLFSRPVPVRHVADAIRTKWPTRIDRRESA